MKKYAVLEHLTLPDRGLRFWTTNHENCECLSTGEKVYKKIIETDSTDVAISMSSKINREKLATMSELCEYYKNNTNN